MAAPTDWSRENVQNPQFNQGNFSQMNHNQMPNMLNNRMEPTSMPPPGFNQPFNQGFNFNAAVPPPRSPMTFPPNQVPMTPGSNIRENYSGGNQNMPQSYAPASWRGPPSYSRPMAPNQMSLPPPLLQGPQQNWNNQNDFNKNPAILHENTNYGLQPSTSNIEINEQEQDKIWVQKWCKERTAKSCASKTESKHMKISEAQDKTRQMIIVLARLQKHKQMLETLKDEDKSIWDQKLKEVEALKSELEGLQRQLLSEDNLKQLLRKIERRKQKRERMKYHRHLSYQEKIKQLTEREAKHTEIDKAMEQIVRKQALEKQDKDMQKEADEVLSQVRKKQAEANKYLQIVNSLSKLRKLRTDRLERQGVLSMYESRGNVSTGKLLYEVKVNDITKLLNSQLEIYNSEEAALKVHLETEQEVTREKEREKNRRIMIEKQKQNQKKEEQMLFGNQRNPVPGDPLYPFRQYYNSACNDFNHLINIRRDWDQYLSAPGTGSCIPEDWVIPSEPSSDTWASVLKQ
ncbi:Programmed cell death 7 [Mactra antiquata]